MPKIKKKREIFQNKDKRDKKYSKMKTKMIKKNFQNIEKKKKKRDLFIPCTLIQESSSVREVVEKDAAEPGRKRQYRREIK